MNDRHVLITGGSGGLGTAVTSLFIERGAQVTVPVYNSEQMERLAGTLGDNARRVEMPMADMSREGDVRHVIGGMEIVDVVVHLIGGFAMGPTDEFKLEDFDKQIAVNLTTAFLVIKHALPLMKRDEYGRIVTVGSRAAVEPQAQMAAYSAAKAGVVALTKSVAEETRELNITANCVLPSVIDTPANRKAMGEDDAHKWVTPKHLAEAIVYLASDDAGALRGAALPIYGKV